MTELLIAAVVVWQVFDWPDTIYTTTLSKPFKEPHVVDVKSFPGVTTLCSATRNEVTCQIVRKAAWYRRTKKMPVAVRVQVEELRGAND